MPTEATIISSLSWMQPEVNKENSIWIENIPMFWLPCCSLNQFFQFNDSPVCWRQNTFKRYTVYMYIYTCMYTLRHNTSDYRCGIAWIVWHNKHMSRRSHTRLQNCACLRVRSQFTLLKFESKQAASSEEQTLPFTAAFFNYKCIPAEMPIFKWRLPKNH